MISIPQQAKSPMVALGFSLLMAMPRTLRKISCYMLKNMKSMSFASLCTPHMHCKMSSVRIFQKHDLMGFNSLGCSRILTIQEVLSSRHGGTCSAKYKQDDQGGVPGGNFQPICHAPYAFPTISISNPILPILPNAILTTPLV